MFRVALHRWKWAETGLRILTSRAHSCESTRLYTSMAKRSLPPNLNMSSIVDRAMVFSSSASSPEQGKNAILVTSSMPMPCARSLRGIGIANGFRFVVQHQQLFSTVLWSELGHVHVEDHQRYACDLMLLSRHVHHQRWYAHLLLLCRSLCLGLVQRVDQSFSAQCHLC
ncbi:hypothetical protein GOODEAATRI_018415 [Goodea atripinnis]|uniref:Uncharacterized protein n=1 Tax=Goodea atripinnis TaxID=208336 RepID=A0ABV0PZ24_9TELE